ncbi:MAG TPA: hypothetical protein VJ352_14550, partial [Geodermatophilus sp.]|nr:hypothetical protein [Geodermatophilus sp.]
ATQQKADDAIAAVGATQQKADAAIAAVERTQQRSDAAIAAVERTQQRSDEAIDAVGTTVERSAALIGRADGAVGATEGLVGRIDPLLARYEEPLTRLVPSVRRLAETLEPHEVEALVTLLDRLPTLVDSLDQTVIPVLSSLEGVGTDVHDLVDTMQDLRQVVKGFPGSKLFRRRGAEEIAENDGARDDEEEAQERVGS